MDKSVLLDLFTDTSRLHNSYVERKLAQRGIHSGQGAIISALAILGPCSQKELADFRRVSPATISVMLGRMESRGLVTRTPSEEGGKRNMISLTENGWETARTLGRIMPREAEKIFRGLSEEDLEVAERLFRTVCANMTE